MHICNSGNIDAVVKLLLAVEKVTTHPPWLPSTSVEFGTISRRSFFVVLQGRAESFQESVPPGGETGKTKHLSTEQ